MQRYSLSKQTRQQKICLKTYFYLNIITTPYNQLVTQNNHIHFGFRNVSKQIQSHKYYILCRFYHTMQYVS